jgi:hypothetical protein
MSPHSPLLPERLNLLDKVGKPYVITITTLVILAIKITVSNDYSNHSSLPVIFDHNPFMTQVYVLKSLFYREISPVSEPFLQSLYDYFGSTLVFKFPRFHLLKYCESRFKASEDIFNSPITREERKMAEKLY